jgi:hypothetical protein
MKNNPMRFILQVIIITVCLISLSSAEIVAGITGFNYPDESFLASTITEFLIKTDIKFYDREAMSELIKQEQILPGQLWDSTFAGFIIEKYYIDLLITGNTFQAKDKTFYRIGLLYKEKGVNLMEHYLEGTRENISMEVIDLINDNLKDYIEPEPDAKTGGKPLNYADFLDKEQEKKLQVELLFSDKTLSKTGSGESRNTVATLLQITGIKDMINETLTDEITPAKYYISFKILKSGEVKDLKIEAMDNKSSELNDVIKSIINMLEFEQGENFAEYYAQFSLNLYY